MGIQIHIELDKLSSSVNAFTEVETDIVEDEYGVESVFTYEHTTLTAPDGTSRSFNRFGDGLWVDANSWGTNRAHYIPWLKKHGIEYIES